MKKIFMMALAAACALTACTTKGGAQGETAEGAAREVGSSDIAYVQVEAVLAQCDLYLKEGVALQEKYEKGLITTRDAQAKQESIQKRAASFQSATQKEAQTLDEENVVFTNRAQDLLRRAVDEINADKKYKLIINASALIDADTTLNITPAVLAKVNELYAAEAK